MWRCARCGKDVTYVQSSIQHRKARGMGGTNDPSINSPANLIEEEQAVLVLDGHVVGVRVLGNRPPVFACFAPIHFDMAVAPRGARPA